MGTGGFAITRNLLYTHPTSRFFISFFITIMSFRRGSSLVSDYAKACRINQLSRQVETLRRELHVKEQQLSWKDEQLSLKDQQLNDAEAELDELMNAESQRIQALEDERREVFISKTQAEIKAERFQRRTTQLERQVEELQRSMTELSFGKSEADLKTEKLQDRVKELETTLEELQRNSITEKAQSGTEMVPSSEDISMSSSRPPQHLEHTQKNPVLDRGIHEAVPELASLSTSMGNSSSQQVCAGYPFLANIFLNRKPSILKIFRLTESSMKQFQISPHSERLWAAVAHNSIVTRPMKI
ncbi:hypothetical protein FB446DRAFT_220719 [Lentinula raphanica]|nr:hypothetical protein FB446DRAFT_220719 [Lentinula raphanica]